MNAILCIRFFLAETLKNNNPAKKSEYKILFNFILINFILVFYTLFILTTTLVITRVTACFFIVSINNTPISIIIYNNNKIIYI